MPFASPYAAYSRRYTLSELEHRLIVPSAMPTPLDPVALKLERERLIRARIHARIQELESVPSNLANDAISSVVMPSGSVLNPPSDAVRAKLHAVIELKSLRLFEKQRELRSQIAHALSHATTLATAIDRSSFRRMKKQSLREARQTELQERAQRKERENRERQKHVDYVQSILAHSRDFLAFHKQQQARANKLGASIIRHHALAAKEEERRLQQMSQERLNALKANDEEAYLKLIDKTKDTRITHLLEQTNSFLNTLMNAVEKQKTSVGSDFEIPLLDQSAAIVEDDDPDGTRDYFATAHRIKEEVTVQPSILIGGTLKDYQLKGLQWMVSLYNNRLNGILADEMGLGKTIQTLSLITYLIEKKKQPGPFLVLVPLSTMTNWVLEFERWAPAVVKIVYKGSPNERKQLAATVKAGGFNVLLTTFEYVINPKDRPVLSKVKWVHMIIDEGHRMKNAESRLSTTLVQYYSARYRLILTGTPLQNNLPELWALLNFILPKIFNSVKSFDEWFNSPFQGSSGQEKIELNEEEQLLIIRRLHKVLRPFLLRRLKKDVESELPDKVETVVKCPMSALQHVLYDQIRNRRFGNDAFKKKAALNNLVMQFRKICNHPFVFEGVEETINPAKITDDLIFRSAGKFELLDRMLPKFKVTGHRHPDLLPDDADYGHYGGLPALARHTYLRLDGHTKPEERTAMLKRFNNPDDPPFIFLLSTRAGGLGLNLQTADTVIIYDSDWNPHQDLQAQDRAHRIGQKKEVRILRLITTKSVEETILARAQYKLDIDGKVIQAGKFDNKTSDNERDELLRSLFGADDDEEEKDEAKENAEGEMDDAELNEIIARNDTELEIFTRMDRERIAATEAAWRSRGNRGDPPPRLMQESELPPAFFAEQPEADELQNVGEIFLGRGGRVRKEVAYDDGLNEDQWLSAVDNGDVEGFIAKKKAQKQQREASKQRRVQKQQGGDNDDQADEDGDGDGMDDGRRPADTMELPDPVHEDEDGDDNHEQPTPAKQGSKKRTRARGRRSGAADDDEMTVEDEQDVDETPRGKKRAKKSATSRGASGGGGGVGPGATESHKKRKKLFAGVDPDEPDTVDPTTRAALRRVFMASYKAVEEAEVEIEGYTRKRSELYLALPDRAEYADYYKYISNPIAMDMILHRANHAFYKDVSAFVADFHLMFANAMTYNMEGSEVWEDAVEMKKIFDEQIAMLCPGGQVAILQQDIQPNTSGDRHPQGVQHSHEAADQQLQYMSDGNQHLPRIRMKINALMDDDDDDEDHEY
ncbi:SNF2 family N-terminal domain-containing protein [Entophlyctis helioformis]|nr:SNF2 family N-terminal domain-containing protein [Entophlyctis helioformis]